MSVRKEELRPQERRSDEELQAVLAENSASIKPLEVTAGKLVKQKDALYKQYIAPVDTQLASVRDRISQKKWVMFQAEAELKVNRKAREVEERVRIKAEERRLAVEGRRVYADGLRQRLIVSADTLDKEPVHLSRSLAGALKRVVEHPNFEESATGKIRVRGKDGVSMRIILGEANSEYFLSYNSPSETQVGKTVRQITEEAADRGGFEGAIVRNFIGFRVDPSDNHPVIPFVLIRQDRLRTSRMLLPMAVVDERFEAPLEAITHMVQNGDILLQTSQRV